MFAKSKQARALGESQLSDQELQLVAGGVYYVEAEEGSGSANSVGSLGDGTIGGVTLPWEKIKFGVTLAA